MRGLLSDCVKDREPVVHCSNTAETLSAAAWSPWRSSICGTMCVRTNTHTERSRTKWRLLINVHDSVRLILETITSSRELLVCQDSAGITSDLSSLLWRCS